MTDRATSAVVGKALEAAIIVLFVGLLTTTLYGGAVPEYRTAAGQEVAERTLADASGDLHAAVPGDATAASAAVRVDLPPTIRGSEYAVAATGDRLVLEHPNQKIGAQTPLVLPETVVSVEGRWESRDPAFVRVESEPAGLAVRLERGVA
jgi:hypothetical protein